VTDVIAAIGTLDLGNLGAKVAEKLGSQWSGDHSRKIEDADAMKRTGCFRSI